MVQPPVIFMAIAQDDSLHLPMLKQESRQIYRALQALHDKQFLELYRDESVIIEDVFEDFRRYHGRISIFHYAGHANSEKLFLEDEAANMSGLAELLSREKEKLKLVFLNGCSTRKQVMKLHELGIEAVIATSVPISDNRACRFASAFYQALSYHYSLEDSFKHASAFMKTVYGENFEVGIHNRGFEKDNYEQEAELAWGLYIREGSDSVLEWKLPQFVKIEVPLFNNKTTEVNQGIRSILNAMMEHAPELEAESRNPRKAPITIVENFPWVMGAQIRKLFANTEQMNQPGRARLKQLVQTYVVSTQFLSYVELSQLWDNLRGKFIEDENEWNGFFPIREENHHLFDYVNLMRSCHRLLENQKSFIEEIGGSISRLDPGQESFEHYRFLESLRFRLLNDEIEDGDVRQLCFDTEAALTDLLVRASFLAKYRLLTIKDIRIFNPKFINPLFSHRLGELNVPHKDYIWEDDRSLNIYTESHSVLLVRKNLGGDIQKFLNLSPFIIDKSAFLVSQVPAIYTFAYPGENKYVFQSVDRDINNPNANTSDILSIDDQQTEYQMVYQLFELFQEDLNRKLAS